MEKSNMKSLEQELHCSVCKDIVKQPVVLPCQHSVCLMCASEVLVANGYPPPDLPPEPNSPASTPNTRSPRQVRRPTPKSEQRPIDRVLRSGPHLPSPSMPRSPGYGTYQGRRRKEAPPLVMMFPCIPCGQDVELGEKGLTDCLRNLTLERIVERYRHTVSLGSVAVMCQFCKPPQALEATKGCADCRSNFCNECFKLYHPWGTPRAQHEHIPPTLNFRPKVLTCPEHDQEKLQFYCRSCQRLLCPLCKLRRIHTGHKVLPVAHAYQALKEKITKEMNYIQSNQDTVLSQITQLESSITQTEVNSVSAREQLAQSIRDLTAALAERHSSLTQALESTRKKRGEALSAQVLERRGLMEHAGFMAFTQELLKETDQPCFVQAARQTHNRFSKAIENLQHFTLAADPSFRHFQLDVAKELKLLTDLTFIKAPVAPVIDTQHTMAYDQLFLCWRLPQESAPAWHYSVEYRRRGVVPGGASRGGVRGGLAAARWGWQRLDEVSGTSAVIDRLEMDSVYVLRVRGCNKAGYGEYSEEVYLHTPPAPVLNFYLDSRWGLHADRLVVSKEQRCARSVPGLSLLQAADQALTSCHLTSDLLVGDVAITQGRHYWACSVEPGSYLVKVGVGLESKLQEWFHLPQDMASPRYDPDSGHDSGAEDALDSAPPFCFLTMGMGKIYLPQHNNHHHHHSSHGNGNRDHITNGNGSSSPTGVTYPLPPRLGVCLDFEKGRVTFYDAHSLRPLWEGHVDCSGPVCPAFCFIGGGALQLQELVANRNADQTPVRRVTIQARGSNLNNN
ncbi:tripartite motif-containing 46b isoform X3 [Gymnodraco acuticeps]|uniref:Tripartite motif-containing 46b isoform X3 n=1 Tax=Gymnodraco acuticeps TaxID=8218 RepID=A0A6P8U5L5_GYMAC|nr:tripartite motif-containing 46b isoform X3 [Pseudochaenichthys georgianus]XP_034066400.1 tripartite motif-containing 46b isoform X3 [Gymnodraco acuticeps]